MSALQRPEEVLEEVAKEVALGRLVGTFSNLTISGLRVSP